VGGKGYKPPSNAEVNHSLPPHVRWALFQHGMARPQSTNGDNGVQVWTVELSLCLTNYALRHEGVWGSGCINPHFLDLGTSWR
jgi:hypothetical protein